MNIDIQRLAKRNVFTAKKIFGAESKGKSETIAAVPLRRISK
jgi:hypothetical protein